LADKVGCSTQPIFSNFANFEQLFKAVIEIAYNKYLDTINEVVLLNKYPVYKNRIIIGSFHDEIEREIKTKYPHLLRGASTGSAVKFILTQFLFINAFDDGDFACLQIPTSYDVGIEVTLISSSIVDRAHARNMAVQYWTVNDADLMRTLIELGCDGITTDDPVLLKQVLMEYK
jgi:glycerophosphoryl diester phosphodiesterase